MSNVTIEDEIFEIVKRLDKGTLSSVCFVYDSGWFVQFNKFKQTDNIKFEESNEVQTLLEHQIIPAIRETVPDAKCLIKETNHVFQIRFDKELTTDEERTFLLKLQEQNLKWRTILPDVYDGKFVIEIESEFLD